MSKNVNAIDDVASLRTVVRLLSYARTWERERTHYGRASAVSGSELDMLQDSSRHILERYQHATPLDMRIAYSAATKDGEANALNDLRSGKPPCAELIAVCAE